MPLDTYKLQTFSMRDEPAPGVAVRLIPSASTRSADRGSSHRWPWHKWRCHLVPVEAPKHHSRKDLLLWYIKSLNTAKMGARPVHCGAANDRHQVGQPVGILVLSPQPEDQFQGDANSSEALKRFVTATNRPCRSGLEGRPCQFPSVRWAPVGSSPFFARSGRGQLLSASSKGPEQ